jgi:hypothetical protein
MNTKPKTKNVGASTVVLAPQKEHVFSINVVEKETRVGYINSAPQEEIRNVLAQETRRRQIRAD